MKPELLNSFKGYKKSYLFNDLFAGLMVAIIAMPLSIALGIQSVPDSVSSYGINYGIVTAIIAGFIISALGGSKFQIGGPTAAFVVILYGYLADPKIGILGLAVAGVMAGIILVLMGVFKVGRIMKYFPYPITIGFTTGIGITLIVGQIKDFCGFTSGGASVIDKISGYIANISTFGVGTFVVGMVGLLIVLILPKINRKLPSAFIALIVCTGVSLLINNVFGGHVMTIGMKYGDIKAGFVLPNLADISTLNISNLIVPAIVIALLGAIESLLSATVASGMTSTSYDPNQELLGQGVANIFSSLFGGLPATGAIARTAANIDNNAKSPLAGMFHAVFLFVMYYLLMGVLKFVPLAVFSAILIGVAKNMSKFSYCAKLLRFGIRDSIVLVVTCVLTVLFDLTYGVAGGVVLALILNIPAIKKGLKIETNDNSNVIKVSGSLMFINADKFATTLSNKLDRFDRVIVDTAQLDRIDQTSLEKIAKLIRMCKGDNKAVEMVNLNVGQQKRYDTYTKIL